MSLRAVTLGKPMVRAVVLLLAVAAGVLVVSLLMLEKPAQAAFPGQNGKIAFLTSRDGNNELYTANADGTGVARLTSTPVGENTPAWAPDGKRLAFTRHPSALGCCPSGNWDIFVRNGDGSETQITSGSGADVYPAWSPDGNKIVYTSTADGSFQNENSRLFVANADGSGTPQRLTSDTFYEITPAWSPDGTKIAYTGGRDSSNGNGEIYVVNANGSGTPQRLAAHTTVDGSPSWSPDGTKIAWNTNRNGNYEIYVMNADGSGTPQRLTNRSAGGDFGPDWSPDGTKIAFASTRDGNGEAYLMNADGSNQTNITNAASSEQGPVWQPISGLVAYYPFSGDAKDASGNGHDGTLEGGANNFPTDVPSSAGAPSSLSFDGSDDAVSVPDDPALDFGASNPMTISLWAKKTSNPGSGIYHILGKREGCGAMNYQLARDSSGFHFNSQVHPAAQVSTSVNDLTLDKWTHLAVTYDPTSSTLKIYADGELVGSDDSYELGPTHGDPLMIGASGTCRNTFPGLLDEVRIYNRALGATEIGSLAKPTPSDTTKPTLNLPSDMTVKATDSNGAVVSYTATATDDKDGTITPTCTPASGSPFPIGSTTVNCSAKDAAGNEATGSFTVNVVYDFGDSTGGIFAEPVNQTALNKVKAGRGVPVKFGLGGDFGLNIFATGYPASKRISCDTQQSTDPVEETVAISTSDLKYDPTTEQYIYGWKTDKAWAGSCRQLVLKFKDGTSQPVNFQFT